MDPQVFRCKVFNTLHVQEVYFQSWIYGPPGIQVQSIEYFAHARSIFSKLDIWTPGIQVQSIEYFACARSIFFEVGCMDSQVFGCKVLNTLHVQEVFVINWIYGPPDIQVQNIEYFACARSIFSRLDIWTPRYLGAKY